MDINNMSNYELGVIVNAFFNCKEYDKCADCPCDGILCGHDDFGYAREFLGKEVAKRLMDSN